MEQSIEDTTLTSSSPQNERPSSIISINSTSSTSERLTPAARRREASRQKDRNKDIEFATEIGQGLLLEVRRLQGELHENLEKIKDLETNKAELERTIEALNKLLRNSKESEEKYKQEIFDLEAKYEYLKIEKALATATDVIEQLKDKQDKLSEALDNSKSRHEKDMANNRRHVAALKREKSDLTKNLDELQTQLDNLLATKNLRKRGQDVATSVDGETDSSDPLNSGAAGVSPTSSSTLPGSNLGKDDVMKALDTANRMICGLRANLQKEKSEKYELKKLLADNQEQIEILQYESEFQGRANVNGSKNAQFNGKGGDDEYDDRSTSTSTISRKEFKSVEVQTEDKSAGISGTEFRSVEVQTEEVSSSLEDNNTSSIINNKEAPLQNSLNTPSTSKDFEQQAGLSKISKYIDGKNLEGLNDSVSTNSSRTSTDQIIRQIDSSNVDSGSGVGGGQIMDSNYNNETTTTDPDIIRLITRTMVGDDLWKYYKPNFGGGILEKRHKRFFWVHPYSKILYWSVKNPATLSSLDPKSRNGLSHFAHIVSVSEVPDNNPSPTGLYHMSLVVKTPDREIKMTAPTEEKHNLWYQGLSYLSQRNEDSEQQNGLKSVNNNGNNGNYSSRSVPNPWDNQIDVNNGASSSNESSNLRDLKKRSSLQKLQGIFKKDGSSSFSSYQNSPLSNEMISNSRSINSSNNEEYSAMPGSSHTDNMKQPSSSS
ncbi:2146_t:CDS:2 [Entrophospora sp. SA101]|nr:2146_t:CDS:2 [Entrophospora sp. SA101]